MPTVTVDQLISETRVMSGLMDNEFLSDDDILAFINDAFQELDDTFTASMQHWRRATYDFTLAGGTDGNALDLAANVPNFQMTQGVDDLNDPQYPRTVTRLGSFANRNTGGFGTSSKQFLEDGNTLFIYPPNRAQGSYRLIYTPQSTTLLPEQTASWDIGDSASMTGHQRTLTLSSGDHIDGAAATIYIAEADFDENDLGLQVNINTHVQTVAHFVTEVIDSGTVVVNATMSDDPLNFAGDEVTIADVSNIAFPNAEFTDDMVGGTITIAFNDGDNEGDNGTFDIYAVLSPTFVQIRNPAFSSLTNPTAGTVSTAWQPPGTVAELPVLMSQWATYLKLYASIAVREAQELEVGEFEKKLNALKVRIKSMSNKRSEGVAQAPITRRRFGYGFFRGYR